MKVYAVMFNEGKGWDVYSWKTRFSDALAIEQQLKAQGYPAKIETEVL